MKTSTFLTILLFGFASEIDANELESLQASYEREKTRVMAPVDQKYDQALQELKLKYTKAGRLEEALAVLAVIESREKTGESDWLQEGTTKWKWHSGGQFEIRPNGECQHSSWQNPGIWKRLSENEIEVVNEKEQVFTLTFKGEDQAEVNAKHGWRTKITRIQEE